MNFTISPTELKTELALLSKVQSAKNSLPILSCVHVELRNDGSLMLTTSDSEITLTSTIHTVEHEGEGVIAIELRQLLQSIKELPDVPVRFLIDGLGVKVDYGTGSYTFVGQDGSEFPKFEYNGEGDNKGFTVQSTILSKSISCCATATASDELRPQMNGVCVDHHDGITFVGSDGHKLICNSFPQCVMPDNTRIVISHKACNALSAMTSKVDASVAVITNGVSVHFSLDGYSLCARLIEGRYPNYSSVIPNGNDKVAIVDRQSLSASVRRTSIFSPQSTNTIALEFGNDSITIKAKDIDFSTSAEATVACEYSSAPIRIGFNAEILRSLLDQITTINVRIELCEPSRGVIIRPVFDDEEDTDAKALFAHYLSLIMPVALDV